MILRCIKHRPNLTRRYSTYCNIAANFESPLFNTEAWFDLLLRNTAVLFDLSLYNTVGRFPLTTMDSFAATLNNGAIFTHHYIIECWVILCSWDFFVNCEYLGKVEAKFKNTLGGKSRTEVIFFMQKMEDKNSWYFLFIFVAFFFVPFFWHCPTDWFLT